MISSRDLTALPKIEELKELTQSLAMLDAIIMREWDHRYYSFNCKWAEGEQMASMRNGEGDGWYCCFGFLRVFLKGFETGALAFSRSLLPTNLTLFSRLLQLPIPLGVDLRLTPGEHVLRCDVCVAAPQFAPRADL